MGQIALGIVGAVASTYAGAGPAVGWAVGSAVGGLLFAPEERVTGPRLEDLTVQGSTYGQPIPRYWGTYRAAGNVIWTSGIEETSHEAHGGKGGPRITTDVYTYSASFAVSFGAGPIAAVRRIWCDGKLIYDLGADVDIETALSSYDAATAIRFYPGTEDQPRDPLIEAVEGADATPAYRGQIVIVFESLQLADFGNRIPNVTAELVAEAETASNLIDNDNHWEAIPGNIIRPASYLLADAHGTAHLTVNQWSASYGNRRVKYWRVYPDGTSEYRYEFTGPTPSSGNDLAHDGQCRRARLRLPSANRPPALGLFPRRRPPERDPGDRRPRRSLSEQQSPTASTSATA